MQTITIEMLHSACHEQKAIFRREWPDGAPLTLANVQRAATARKARDEATAPAWFEAVSAR